MTIEKLGARVEKLDDKVDQLATRFDALATTVDTLTTTVKDGFASMNKRFEEVDNHFDILVRAMTFGFGRVDERLNTMNEELTRQSVMMEVMDVKIVALAEGHAVLFEKTDRIEKQVDGIDDRLNRVEGGIYGLDTRLKRVETGLRLNSGAV